MPKTDLVVDVTQTDGNIFNLAGLVSTTLKRNGHRDYAKEVKEKLFGMKSYDDALLMLREYVEFEV